MGNFWDVFVFRVCAGLYESYPFGGARTARGILTLARQLGLLDLSRLNDLSLLLIVLTCEDGRPIQQEAYQLAVARGLTSPRPWAILREALPPRLTDLLLLGNAGQPRQRAVVSGVLATLYLPSLVRYQARLALVEYHVARAFVAPLFRQAADALDAISILEDEFLCQLYARVADTPWPNAADWPAVRPAWHRRCGVDERHFVDCCLSLWPGERLALYLSFYARLNAAQIACVYRPDVPDLNTTTVVEWLDDTWRAVLNGMAEKAKIQEE
jgi:hypothetical protein